jgi:hypothetical protein
MGDDRNGRVVKLVPGGRMTPEDIARKVQEASVQPYAIMYAKVSAVTAVVLCRCKGVAVVVDSLERPSVCPVCGALYYIGAIRFDAVAHYSKPENQREDAPQPPVQVDVVRVEPRHNSGLIV